MSMKVKQMLNRFLKLMSGKLNRFILIGLIATGVNYASFLIFHYIFEWSPFLANGMAYAVSFVFNFVFTHLYTFKIKVTLKSSIKFSLIHLNSFVCNQLLFMLFSLFITSQWIIPILVNLMMFILNFSLSNKFLTHKETSAC